ncbi:MAG: hypothetical protein A2Y10_20520 [Planctomycetes bacterium GWF2_41_51]|nr:MAG: hypothetical protein A2Y10_20520 [Planctomycetes bacterium GWF2_41_51]HBG25701.1 hypothetical protein [Phycisphaerales bacterium]
MRFLQKIPVFSLKTKLKTCAFFANRNGNFLIRKIVLSPIFLVKFNVRIPQTEFNNINGKGIKCVLIVLYVIVAGNWNRVFAAAVKNRLTRVYVKRYVPVAASPLTNAPVECFLYFL